VLYGDPGPKFIKFGNDVQQGLDYQCAKFHLRDIRCRTSLVLFKARPTNRKTVNDTSLYTMRQQNTSTAVSSTSRKRIYHVSYKTNTVTHVCILNCTSCSLNCASTTPTQPFYGPFSGTTRVSRCQKRTSGLYGARRD